MRWLHVPALFLLLSITHISLRAQPAPPIAIPDGVDPLQACEALVQTDQKKNHLLYEKELKEMLTEFQMEGNLEAYLAVREEIRRFERDPTLHSSNLVDFPEELRFLQLEHIRLDLEIVADAVLGFSELLNPKKRELTIAGKIDEAIVVMNQVSTIREKFKPQLDELRDQLSVDIIPISAENLAKAYARNENRANRMYMGKTVRVTGNVRRIDQSLTDRYDYKIELTAGEHRVPVVVTLNTKGEKKKPDLTGIGSNQQFILMDGEDKLTLRVGMKITVDGICQGSHVGVQINDITVEEKFWVRKVKEEEDLLDEEPQDKKKSSKEDKDKSKK